MNIHFLGTGEAADPTRRNTSVLVETGDRHHLLDCGFNSAQAYLRRSTAACLETVWISHFHGDHFFGIPQLILHFYLQKRKLPLTLLAGSSELRDKVNAAVELAYPGLTSKLTFSLHYHQIEQHSATVYNGLSWQCAPANHSQQAYGLRITTDSRKIYYSGDGKPTPGCISLMHDCDLVIHEAFSVGPEDPSHFSLEECLELVNNSAIEQLALVHLNQQTRQAVESKKDMLHEAGSTRVVIPKDGVELRL